MHRIWVERLTDTPGSTFWIEGDEAHHALRVKRLGPGDPVEIFDGQGLVAQARVEGSEKAGKHGWRLHLRLESVRREPPAAPRLEVFASTPKGAQVETMVDQLTQVGAALWRPLLCARTEVDPRPAKLDRLARHAREAAKQCARAWTMEIGEAIPFEQALRGDADTAIIVGHADGSPYRPSGHSNVRLLIGPVGDFEPAELALATASGATIASFGPHVMRIETAAVVAGAIILDRERH